MPGSWARKASLRKRHWYSLTKKLAVGTNFHERGLRSRARTIAVVRDLFENERQNLSVLFESEAGDIACEFVMFGEVHAVVREIDLRDGSVLGLVSHDDGASK